MPSLADLQADMCRALVSGDADGLAPRLVGGSSASKRLAIHQRHYETSLVTALLEKYPASAWLLGSRFLTSAARDFVRIHPPTRPCLAEYGDDFPAFVGSFGEGPALPYIRSFAELEWHVGQVSIAIDRPALEWSDLARLGADTLMDAVLTLQPGVRYLRAFWAVDDLMRLYLADAAPPRFKLPGGEIRIQVRGARGELSLDRLDEATLVFRQSLGQGRRLTAAAERALECDAAFDLADELTGLVASGLVTAVTPAN